MCNYVSDGHTLRFIGKRPTTMQEALELSIEKWETIAIVNAKEDRILYDGADATCGLCMLYFASGCVDCPVADADDGATYCVANVPYQRYHIADTVEEAVMAAEPEVAYLKSLM